MKILILGGGIGGHVVANLLRKKLGQQHEITVIDKKARYDFSPSFLWATMGWREPSQISRNLSLLEKKGITYINAEVLKINPSAKSVKTSVGEFTYDYLVLALGAELAPYTIPELSIAAHHFYDLDASMKLKDAVNGFSGGNIAIGVSSMPFKCPAAPYEAALLLDYHFRKRGIRDKVNFEFFTPEPQPMPVAGQKIGGMIRQMLEARGIYYHPNLKVASVDLNKKELFFESGEKLGWDLLVLVPPHRVPNVVIEAGLTEGAPWVPVDKWTLRTKQDNVYAVGDVALIKLFDGMALPKAGVFAHNQAKVVAHNIVTDINGGEEKKFDGKGNCFIESGFGKAGFADGEFYAEPRIVNIKKPSVSRIWHLEKIWFEKYWLWRWF